MIAWKKEIIWVLSLLILVGGFIGWNLAVSNNDTVLDINIHETYFVIEYSEISMVLGILFLWVAYLIRILYYRLNNVIGNIVFLIANLCQILIFIYLLIFLNALIQMAGITIYPPLSAPNQIHSDKLPKTLFNATVIFIIVLGIFELFILYITIRNYKRKSKINTQIEIQ